MTAVLNPTGLCQCGCGLPTKIARQTATRLGHVRGQPVRFVKGHWARTEQNSGPLNSQWRGGRYLHVEGYVMVRQKRHPRANKSGYVLEHLLVAERALGFPVPRGVEVHHFNEIKSDNRGSNLVICQDATYHKLLHVRMGALRACGNPDARQCWLCRGWGLWLRPLDKKCNSFEHRECGNRYRREQRHKREARYGELGF